jgi:hypothetical protein
MQVEEVQDGDCGKVEKIEEGKGKGGDRRKRLDFGIGGDTEKGLYARHGLWNRCEKIEEGKRNREDRTEIV